MHTISGSPLVHRHCTSSHPTTATSLWQLPQYLRFQLIHLPHSKSLCSGRQPVPAILDCWLVLSSLSSSPSESPCSPRKFYSRGRGRFMVSLPRSISALAWALKPRIVSFSRVLTSLRAFGVLYEAVSRDNIAMRRHCSCSFG
jgi:hypothetical protein